ncbi:MAG: 4Fe-4S dicluster domain-containing protein [candidate division KSB1 bacterium]|nr:4Fe-4S dicluster domain-containing protein [candidate division KSB1 bacterium]MDZ7335353.1 4Fe-4S dicluster domain-containing protein [candidate division KSB1 bacterium]MDZ7356826.1 4Fe-4S dicluster domain-containing protein [candidate division KSB1 bacterium]MDZ7399039.1 4Fe-4S dicluster domain-containing protein [candidate division KSB1 bacterium]
MSNTEQNTETKNLIPIFIMGKRYDVPPSLTIQKAMEYAGYQLIRGCGCRGGICGACATIYRFPNDYQLHYGLACQTVVEPYMYITQIPFFPANKAVYDLEQLQPTGETVARLYPEIFKCMGCNNCTKSCPMDIKVMDYVAAAMAGDIKKAAELSFDCVMCGLCAARCPAEEVQYNIAILARRLYGRYILPKAEHLAQRVQEVESGKYETMLQELMKADKATLMKLYKERETEPDNADEMWEPAEKAFL